MGLRWAGGLEGGVGRGQGGGGPPPQGLVLGPPQVALLAQAVGLTSTFMAKALAAQLERLRAEAGAP